jgi:TonB family protein
MNPAALSEAQSIAHALGWTLLHFCWQGALIALVLVCVLSLISERAPQQRYFSACTALFLMIVTPVVTFLRIIASHRDAPAAFTFIPLETITVKATGTPSEPLLQRIADSLDRSMSLMLALWLAGVLFLLARLILGLYLARRMKFANIQQPSDELLAGFQSLAQRIGVSRPVRLLHSALVQVPTVIGWLRPVVLVPFGCLTGLSEMQLEAILAHELAHIRRHDYLITVLQTVVEALLFYHPAVWWVSRRIRAEREHCCDDLAVRIGGNPLLYARALSLLAEKSLAMPTTTLAANGGVLTMRIKRLLRPQEGPATSQFAAVTVLALVVALAGISIGATAHAQARSRQLNPASLVSTPVSSTLIATEGTASAPLFSRELAAVATADHQEPGAPKLSREYQQWLDQDVRYIITPSEHADFLHLTNDADRDSFINAFWRRRDPAGSPENTARSQHYQRIAYANQHFAEGSTLGWQTDRGRMYIINGAPTSIDSHPSGSNGGNPYEVWDYMSSKGPGQSETIRLEFADLCNCGQYHLRTECSKSKSSSSSSSSCSSSETNTKGVYPLTDQPSTKQRSANSAPQPSVRAVSYAPPQPDDQSPSGPVKVSPGIMAGQVINATRVNPVYPSEAKTNHIEGAVVLHVLISPEGDVTNVQVVSGPSELYKSAIIAVSQWKYKPYLLNGQPIAVDSNITINYSLTNDEEEHTASGVPAKKIGDGVSAPIVVYMVQPQSTQAANDAAKAGDFKGGYVLLHLIVDEQGNVQNIRVERGLGYGLDEKAIQAVKQYRFNPGLENGQPVPVALNIEVNFQTF